jgi:hypothetical protein
MAKVAAVNLGHANLLKGGWKYEEKGSVSSNGFDAGDLPFQQCLGSRCDQNWV